MTDGRPGRDNGDGPEPQDRHGNVPDQGGRRGEGRSPGRHRAARPPRIHAPRPEADPVAPALTREIEMPSRPVAPAYRRFFTVGETEWVAWISGRGAYGTGHAGLGTVQALHFALSASPEKPLRETLMVTGRFEDLFDEELLRLFADSREILAPEPGAAPQRVRRRGEGLS